MRWPIAFDSTVIVIDTKKCFELRIIVRIVAFNKVAMDNGSMASFVTSHHFVALGFKYFKSCLKIHKVL